MQVSLRGTVGRVATVIKDMLDRNNNENNKNQISIRAKFCATSSMCFFEAMKCHWNHGSERAMRWVPPNT